MRACGRAGGRACGRAGVRACGRACMVCGHVRVRACVRYCRDKVVINSKWYSPTCGGHMEISQRGNMRCCHHRPPWKSCVFGAMANFRFDCGLRSPGSPHSDKLPYVKGDRQSFTHAMGTAMSMNYLGSEDLAWVQTLLGSLDSQFCDDTTSYR